MRGVENNLEPALEELELLYKIMEESGLFELDVKDAGTRVKLTKRTSKLVVSSSPEGRECFASSRPESAKKTELSQSSVAAGNLVPIRSPLAGVFYRALSPSSPPFAKENDQIAAGSVLCIIEAMKMMNEIKAEQLCIIKKITVENGKTVQAGQELFLVEPA